MTWLRAGRRRRPPLMPALAVPWYVHPAADPAAWAWLRGKSPSFIVVNVHDGPGAADDPYYPRALAGLAGQRMLGYVHLDYGDRPLAAVTADLQAWTRYPITGVMFDQVPSGAAALPAVRSAVTAARAVTAGWVVGNPGVNPAPEYFDLFDVTCVFEGSTEQYADYQPAPKMPSPQRIWHLIHGCAAPDLEPTLARAATLGAGHAFATDRALPQPWLGPPTVEVTP